MTANSWYCIAQTSVFDSGCSIHVAFDGYSIQFSVSVRYGTSSINVSDCNIPSTMKFSVRLREVNKSWFVDLYCNKDIIPTVTIADSLYWSESNAQANAGIILALITDISNKFNPTPGGGSDGLDEDLILIQKELIVIGERINNIEDWFTLRTLTDGRKVLYTKYNIATAGDMSAGGISEDIGSGEGGSFSRLDSWDDYNPANGDVLSAVLGYGLKTDIQSLQEQINNMGGGGLSSVTVKIGNTAYDSVDGVVSLPSYPVVPTFLSEFTDDVVSGKYLSLSGGILSGALSVPNINITSAAAIAHLAFGRQGGNFITATSGGYLAFIPTGKGIATANADLVITDGHVYPGTTGYTRLGFGDKRWSQVSSVDGDFSGALTAGTFKTSSVVACGGRLRINASNSASSFGFLKATAYSSALNVGVLDIGSNYGGSSDITSEAVDVVAMSMYRGAVGVGRAFTYDELYANKTNNVMLSVEGNINNVGDVVSTGEQVAGSDMRYKIVKSKFHLSSAIIAQAPLFRFKWKNRETTKLKIGTSAQYWEEFAPELVTFDSVSDFKHLNYAGLGVAIGISNAREIEQLKKEIVLLKEKLARYEHN